MNRLLVCLAALTLGSALAAQNPTHYWVDAKNGSDTNAGTRAQPFQTITKATSLLNSDVVVHILPGVYGPATTGDFWNTSTSAGAKINLNNHRNFRILGEDRATCIIDFKDPNGAPMDNVWYGMFQISGQNTDGVEIANLTFKNIDVAVVWGTGPINVTGTCRNVDIHGCYFENTGSTFICWGGFDVAFHDNVIVSTGARAGQFVPIRVRTQYFNASEGDRPWIYNNTIYNAAQGISYAAVYTHNNQTHQATQYICNNIVLNASGTGFPGSAPTNLVNLENNIAFGCLTNFAYTPPASNLTVDPMLVDPANGDFHQKTGSPCYEGGYAMGLGSMVNDYYGNARVSDDDGDLKAIPDIGAHEMVEVGLGVSSFGQGQTASFQVSKLGGFAGPALFFLGWGGGSLVIDPFGSFGIDPLKILFVLPTTVPGTLPLPFPKDPAFDGLPLYFQAMGFRPVSGGVSFKPSGTLRAFL